MTKEKAKKPFYKKWWVWVAAIIIISIVTPGEEEETDAEPKEKVAETASAPVEEKKEGETEKKVDDEATKQKEEDEKKKAEEKTNAPLTSGENGVLVDDVFIGLGEDKENYDEMFIYITKGNQEALMNMVLEGKVYFAEKGTPITVVDRGFINAKIQVIETGDRGWVPVEFLARSVE